MAYEDRVRAEVERVRGSVPSDTTGFIVKKGGSVYTGPFEKLEDAVACAFGYFEQNRGYYWAKVPIAAVRHHLFEWWNGPKEICEIQLQYPE